MLEKQEKNSPAAQNAYQNSLLNNYTVYEKKTSKGLSFTYSFNLIADTNYVKTLDEKQVRQYLVAVGDEATAVDSRTVEELDDELDA